MTTLNPVVYKYTSTKEYHDAFPCAYRQWRADSHCNLIHGYSFSMKFYFGTNDLDVRNWAADYGGLKELKKILEDQFDHTLIVSADDPLIVASPTTHTSIPLDAVTRYNSLAIDSKSNE